MKDIATQKTVRHYLKTQTNKLIVIIGLMLCVFVIAVLLGIHLLQLAGT